MEKDLKVFRVGPNGCLNAFFFLPIRVILQILALVRKKKWGITTVGECSPNGKLYVVFGKYESLLKRNLLLLSKLVRL